MKKVVLIAIATVVCGTAFSQSAVVSLGSTNTFNNLEISEISQSVGQVAYTSGQNNLAIVGEGVQQCFSVSSTQNLDGVDLLEIEVKIFPNPSSDVLNVQISDFQENKELQYTLFSTDGKILTEGTCVNLNTQIPVNQLVAGVYLLKISNGKSERNFRIVKH